MSNVIEISGAELRALTGWTSIPHVADDDICVVQPDGAVMWSRKEEDMLVLGKLNDEQLLRLAEACDTPTVEIPLFDILDLIACAEDYGHTNQIIMSTFAEWLGHVLSDEDIEDYAQGYLTEEMRAKGYSEEDYEALKTQLVAWREKWCREDGYEEEEEEEEEEPEAENENGPH
jgi:GNAT superfamily N-acetyltransferase